MADILNVRIMKGLWQQPQLPQTRGFPMMFIFSPTIRITISARGVAFLLLAMKVTGFL